MNAIRGFSWVPCLAAMLFATASGPAPARQASSTHPAAKASPVMTDDAVPAARPSDVSSMNAIMAATYDVISGPKGQKRDWNRMRSLFVPGARLIPAHHGKNGVTRARVLTLEDYIRLAGPYLEKNGFYERETHRTVERYGAIAQVFSTYASYHTAHDAKPFERGINSFQLLYDGHRWWVVTIYWQGERKGLPIPKRFGG